MSVEMAHSQPDQPGRPQKPEYAPSFPYEHLPYTHVHPNSPGPRTHVLFRCHDCWCEPIPIFVWGLKGRPVAILLIHSDEQAPKYPKFTAIDNKT